jgi:hypothetical protein
MRAQRVGWPEQRFGFRRAKVGRPGWGAVLPDLGLCDLSHPASRVRQLRRTRIQDTRATRPGPRRSRSPDLVDLLRACGAPWGRDLAEGSAAPRLVQRRVRAGRFIIDAIACGVRRELMVGCGTRPIVQDCVGGLVTAAGRAADACRAAWVRPRHGSACSRTRGQLPRRDCQSTRRWIGERALTCTM